MELPQYYWPAGYVGQDVVLEMVKSIFGQQDSGKLFYEHLGRGMDKLGFVPLESDPSRANFSEPWVLPLFVILRTVLLLRVDSIDYSVRF
jgi:hypothetical protein